MVYLQQSGAHKSKFAKISHSFQLFGRLPDRLLSWMSRRVKFKKTPSPAQSLGRGPSKALSCRLSSESSCRFNMDSDFGETESFYFIKKGVQGVPRM